MAWRVMIEKKHSTRLIHEHPAGMKCRVIRLFSGLVPLQATFARVTMRRSRSSWVWLLRQMMYRRIMLPCCWWLAWSVPSRAKYRSAVNWASIRFNQDALAGGVGDLGVVRRGPRADPAVGGGAQVRAEVVADDRDADIGRVEGAQVAVELQEPGPGLARLDVPEQLVLAQLVGGEQVPDALGSGVGRAHPPPRCAPGFFALAADRGPLPAGPGLQVQRPELIHLCGHPHRPIYADPATMPRISVAGSLWRDDAGVLRRLTGAGVGIVLGLRAASDRGAPYSREGGECDGEYAEEARSAGPAGRGLPGVAGASGLHAPDGQEHAGRPGASSGCGCRVKGW